MPPVEICVKLRACIFGRETPPPPHVVSFPSSVGITGRTWSHCAEIWADSFGSWYCPCSSSSSNWQSELQKTAAGRFVLSDKCQVYSICIHVCMYVYIYIRMYNIYIYNIYIYTYVCIVKFGPGEDGYIFAAQGFNHRNAAGRNRSPLTCSCWPSVWCEPEIAEETVLRAIEINLEHPEWWTRQPGRLGKQNGTRGVVDDRSDKTGMKRD